MWCSSYRTPNTRTVWSSGPQKLELHVTKLSCWVWWPTATEERPFCLIFYFSISLSLSFISAVLISPLQRLFQNIWHGVFKQAADLLLIIHWATTPYGFWVSTIKYFCFWTRGHFIFSCESIHHKYLFYIYQKYCLTTLCHFVTCKKQKNKD